LVEINFELKSDLSQEEFFKIKSDPEYAQKIVPEILTLIKLISKDGNVSVYEEHSTFKGFRTKSIIQHTIDSSKIHEIKILEGDGEGSIIKEVFKSLPNGNSKLIVTGNLELSGPYKKMSIITKKLIHKIIKDLYITLEESHKKYLNQNPRKQFGEYN
jgi:hypothetical protein